MRVPVVEMCSFDGTATKSWARFVLLPSGKMEVVGLAADGRSAALDNTARGVPGPGGTMVKAEEGPRFLQLLQHAFRGSRSWATPPFEMELDEALRGCLTEGAKVVTLTQAHGPLLISADIHGNWDDFARLREIFLAADARGEQPTWVSVGDWVHGPSAERPPVQSRSGELLYDYADRSLDIVRELFALMDRFPGRVLSLLGNHEHAHIGGPVTRKFHDDEAMFLEAQQEREERLQMRARFASWPLCVRVPAAGVVITHGAMSPEFGGVAELERIRYGAPTAVLEDVLFSAMSWYGFSPGQDDALLARLRDEGGPDYRIIVHGHDREESGYARTAARALLLCSSFGAERARKAYLWLDCARRYDDLDQLREGHEIRFLWGSSPV